MAIFSCNKLCKNRKKWTYGLFSQDYRVVSFPNLCLEKTKGKILESLNL